MQSKANIYFFGMRNDHNRQAEGLWRISDIEQQPPFGDRKCSKTLHQKSGWGEVNWLFNVTINDISVIYVTAHRCAGGMLG